MSWANATAQDLVRVAEKLGPEIIAKRVAIERNRGLPVNLFRALRDAGLFSLWLPKSMGGPELTSAELTRVVEVLSRADGSVGWLAGIASSNSRLAGYLPEDIAGRIWGDGKTVLAGTLNPVGTALPVAGGYRVNGQWAYASGINHSDWLLGSCRVLKGDEPSMGPDGSPETRLMLFPKEQAEVLDTWDVTGMRGSGSHDFRVADLYVPSEYSVDAVTPKPVQTSLLYRLALVTVFNTSVFGVPLGIARAAIDDLITTAASKKPMSSTQPLRDHTTVQIEVGRAEAILRSARAFVFEAIEALWAAGERGEVTYRDRALARMAGSHAASAAVQVVDMMFASRRGGGNLRARSARQVLAGRPRDVSSRRSICVPIPNWGAGNDGPGPRNPTTLIKRVLLPSRPSKGQVTDCTISIVASTSKAPPRGADRRRPHG
jgi:alkylation response protein AidB-like acyl-CoA dehydrogenase